MKVIVVVAMVVVVHREFTETTRELSIVSPNWKDSNAFCENLRMMAYEVSVRKWISCPQEHLELSQSIPYKAV